MKKFRVMNGFTVECKGENEITEQTVTYESQNNKLYKELAKSIGRFDVIHDVL